MRITAANAFETSIKNLQKRQEGLSDAQDRLTSGKRVVTASDDPVAAARAERALAAMVRSEANQRALEASRNVMLQAESALGNAGDLLQQARELVVQGGNGSYGASNRETLADALRGIRAQLLGVANRGDGAGGYVFAGQGADSPPFVDTPGGVIFRGAEGEISAASDEALPLSVDGRQAWLGARDPSGTGTVSVFTALDTVIGKLSDGSLSEAEVSTAVKEGLADIDAVMNNVLTSRAAAGEALNRTDMVESRIAESKLAAKTERSNAEDLDMVQAISDFQNRQTGYDAALKTYSLVQRQSLFQYLSA
ncbi:flagellar hook-associated protein FlgL [Rubrivivax benzoatilyticus]|uniref:Flagellar hook-associated protein 3 n=1 Tax=Rubrivivax benzoatilyticus TaxID=316997 RepID=A0ABX0I233_9BURK|nr:flagellar hook-associated protein FlgL [Rubrivivax benzoatilyticus]EGJ09572.1 flagellin-related hook-associated protein [Rubrivivax benzoatilyticus JA2 = ATCC BAA-35]MCD0418481.1 flagellar hook-associated protein FlgL [Rubrivivax sp. JA1024]NHK99868.1 flagellar hook-associated protein 3 [Rubrivivax benzoatilyticus]NHL25853.1 flagellar hook-associated protein 3 [Rubrivivax benzoatilyticus]